MYYSSDKGFVKTLENAFKDIMYAAYKFDDKPHKLFSAIAQAATETKCDDWEEIVRLMNLEYEKY